MGPRFSHPPPHGCNMTDAPWRGRAVSIALKDSVRHAIAAGELLIEAKGQLKHGQWLP
jgi:hypothetical protein